MKTTANKKVVRHSSNGNFVTVIFKDAETRKFLKDNGYPVLSKVFEKVQKDKRGK